MWWLIFDSKVDGRRTAASPPALGPDYSIFSGKHWCGRTCTLCPWSLEVWGCCLNVRMCYPVDRFRVPRQPEWIPAALIEYRLIEGGTWSYDLRNEETSMIRCKKDRDSKLTGRRLPGRLVSSRVYGLLLPFAKLMAESTFFHHFLLLKPHPLVSRFSHFIDRFTQSSIQISIAVR